MIARVAGTVATRDGEIVVVDVGGVGYLVGASARTLAALAPAGEACVLHTDLLVGEDFLRLVGFATAAGFKLAGRSEINANPKDSADWPEGVWTLPPSYALKDKDRAKYAAIGESDPRQ